MLLDKRMIVFLAVVESESFSEASRRLHLSQSVVSHHIEKLESDLGVQLFERHGRSITITPEGQLLARQGLKLDKFIREIEESFSRHSIKVARSIALGGDALTCAFTLPWMLSAFQKKVENVQFSYKHFSPDEIVEKIVNGEIDMALTGHPVNHRKIETIKCFEDEIHLVTSVENKLDTITIQDLREIPLVWINSDRGLEMTVKTGLTENGIPVNNLNIVMEVEDLPIVKTFIRAGMGSAFLPARTVEDELSSGVFKLIKLDNLKLKRVNYRIFRKQKQRREIFSQFLDFVNNSNWSEIL